MRFGIDTPDFPDSGCAIVFGGSGGLGMASAGLMAQRGSAIVVTYRSRRDESQQFVEQLRGLGYRAEAMACDVTDRAQVDAVYAGALKSFGRVHTVVSAGGLVFDTGPLADFRPESFRGVIETDVVGFFNIAQAGIPVLREGKGGSFVALITCATQRTVPLDALSATPKAAVQMLVRHIATEEARNGIRANSVGPGVVNGGMVIPMMKTETRKLLDMAVEFTPLGRLASCEEIAEAVAYLASSKAAYITGQALMVDGGLSA
ncbi:SDR family NAD(P)-dependent oxidoreductase [Panacagrimonas sp.]|uniref:SDR family NAD(P)-dependent oxidoreductase n=1 Tax=Panacagrimonas sp. TaxID=2480088 RepID=UPI003B520B34